MHGSKIAGTHKLDKLKTCMIVCIIGWQSRAENVFNQYVEITMKIDPFQGLNPKGFAVKIFGFETKRSSA